MPGTHLPRSRRRVDTPAVSSSQGLSKVFDGRQIFPDASQTQCIGSKPPYGQFQLFIVAIKPPAPGYEDHAIGVTLPGGPTKSLRPRSHPNDIQ